MDRCIRGGNSCQRSNDAKSLAVNAPTTGVQKCQKPPPATCGPPSSMTGWAAQVGKIRQRHMMCCTCQHQQRGNRTSGATGEPCRCCRQSDMECLNQGHIMWIQENMGNNNSEPLTDSPSNNQNCCGDVAGDATAVPDAKTACTEGELPEDVTGDDGDGCGETPDGQEEEDPDTTEGSGGECTTQQFPRPYEPGSPCDRAVQDFQTRLQKSAWHVQVDGCSGCIIECKGKL